jgi:hypothetical protein
MKLHLKKTFLFWTGILFSVAVLSACSTSDTGKDPEGSVKVPTKMDTENDDFKTMHDEIMKEADQIPGTY